ncbi:MAG: bifunctional folylpolyglutamate synthase/dihydrofolate synthase, partial [Thermodesulfovibrionales bacterium]|nr:bifunctional folylpolyglutamate synthase/dihydrofolate synthase [Thermodesulfovibrionales bacterium]
MNYPVAIEYIYGLQKFGLKLGLERITNILAILNNPHFLFDSIHIAGTNGKGSVSAMISSMLIEASLKTGLFTSPHLVSFTERIRINNQEITEQEVINLTIRIKSIIEQNKINSTTFFEFVTALCFFYFEENKIDCAVVETGLGGRLDATNVLSPKVSVITQIGIDHSEFLGNSIEKIAFEKAGIIKPNIPVVISAQQQNALNVILRRAKELHSPTYQYGTDFMGILKESTYYGIKIDFRGPIEINDLSIPLAGIHQVENSSTAIMSVYEYLKHRFDSRKIVEIVTNGISKVSWQGRLQFISYSPPLLIDGAHNPSASERLSEFIRTHLKGRKIILIVGIMADKDIEGILSHLLPISDWTIFT